MTVFDIHTHGIGGVDTQTTDPRDILRIAEIHGAQGVDAILAGLYPAPVDAMRAAIAAVKAAMELQDLESSPLDTRPPTLPGARPAAVLGVYLEGPFINRERAGSLDRSCFLAPSKYSFDAIVEGFREIVKVVVIAPELPGALALIREVADLGIRVSMGHSDASWSEAERGFHAGATGVTHLFNAMRPWHHREPGLAGFALANSNLYVEVIADPHHLHRGTLDLVFKIKDPGRIILVSDSVRDTEQHGPGEALVGPSGRLQGGALTITTAARRLIELGYPARTVEAAITANPAAYIAR
jgi:N-acetylglucosamine-6-phosphate deacetylase